MAFCQTLDDNDPLNKEYEPNIYCEEIPEFNEIGRHVFETLEKAGNTILNAIALHLNLEENYFTDKVYKGNSILGLYITHLLKKILAVQSEPQNMET